MKTVFLLLAGLALLLGAASLYFHPLAMVQGMFSPVPPAPAALVAPAGTRLIRSAEGGHVVRIYAWPPTRVARGQVLAHLERAFTSPEQLAAQQAVRQAEQEYARQPTPAQAQALAAQRAHLATLPHLTSRSYIVAPADGMLLRSALLTGHYVSRGSAVAVLTLPAAPPTPLPSALTAAPARR